MNENKLTYDLNNQAQPSCFLVAAVAEVVFLDILARVGGGEGRMVQKRPTPGAGKKWQYPISSGPLVLKC